MEYVSLGRTGLKVSRLCLGCMNFGGRTSEEESLQILRQALDDGLIFWDTANVYNKGRSEEIVGKALRLYGVRNQVILATKVTNKMGDGPNDRGSSRRHIMQQVDESLRRLGTDWIDLYQLHRPDFSTPLEETVEALNDCVRAGKIRYWGTSVFPAWRMAEAWWRAELRGWAKPVCEQAPYNILDRRVENERLPFLQEYGWGLIPWSPLAGGILTGKYPADALQSPPPGTRLAEMALLRERATRRGFEVAREVAALAEQVGTTPVRFAIAWLLHRPGVTAPIIGPASLEQYREYVAALDVRIPDEAMRRIDELVPPGSAVADFHNNSGWYVGALL